jgi:hypothetical protein
LAPLLLQPLSAYPKTVTSPEMIDMYAMITIGVFQTAKEQASTVQDLVTENLAKVSALSRL